MSSILEIFEGKCYLDYAATRPLSEMIMDRFVKYSKEFPFNLSALYSGLDLKEIKGDILEALNLPKSGYRVVVTSSASEALSQAIVGTYMRRCSDSNQIVTTRLEHKSVLKAFDYLESIGAEIIYADCDQYGRADLKVLKDIFRNNKVLLFCSTHVNNESGVVNPVEQIGNLCSEFDVVSIIDTTQSIGKTPFDYSTVNCFCVSSHKLGGINGVGLLVEKGKESAPLIYGTQQDGKRGGSLFAPSLLILRDLLRSSPIVSNLDVKSDYIFGRLNEKLSDWNHLIPENVRVPYIIPIETKHSKVEVMKILDDWIFSFGSSCNSSLEEKSHVYRQLSENEVFRLSL